MSDSLTLATSFQCGLARARRHSITPYGPSSLSTVGRWLAQSPAEPFETSDAKGLARMSACIRATSSTRNCSGRYMALRLHVIAQPVDRGLNAALPVRDTERAEPGLDDPQRAEHHRRIDMAHMGDAKRLAVHRPEPAAKDHAAFAVAILAQGLGVEAVGHQHCGHSIGTLGGFNNVKVDDVALLPHRNGVADRLGQEVMAAEDIGETFG